MGVVDIDTGEITHSWNRRNLRWSTRDRVYDPIGEDESVALSDPRCAVCDNVTHERARLAPTAGMIWLHGECRPEAERRAEWMRARGLLRDRPVKVAPKVVRKPRTRVYRGIDRDEARRLHREEGYGAKAIGKMMDVPTSTIQDWINAA